MQISLLILLTPFLFHTSYYNIFAFSAIFFDLKISHFFIIKPKILTTTAANIITNPSISSFNSFFINNLNAHKKKKKKS